MKIRKIFMFLILILGVFVLSACTSNKNIEGSLEEIMTRVYEDIPNDKRPMMLSNTEVNESNADYYLGIKGLEYKEALASESGVGSIPHSVVLLRVKDNADIEDIKTKIKENINPRKWICVGVEKDDVIVENKGNLIILILVEDEENRQKLIDSFNNLK